jgi:2-polyprenyl-3-methyl-5-hydroxy-6-metoxy-1,4-benzoquinol methylase
MAGSRTGGEEECHPRGRDDSSPTLPAVTTRHPLQPKDWRSGSHAERFARVRRYLENRTVLDIGAGSGIDRPDWMHAAVASVAAEAVGVEIDPELAARARERGYDVIAADAQALELGRTFQVVWAGELIEHLSCAGGFLDAARRHLEPGGQLVLTTPNAFAVSNFVYRIGGRPRINRGHTCWYDETTLTQLLQRHAYEVVEVSYLAHRTPGRVRALVARAVRSLLPAHLAENTLLVVATTNG